MKSLLFLSLFFLCSCTSNLSTQITNNASEEIKAIQKDLSIALDNTPAECKSYVSQAFVSFYSRLNNLDTSIKTIPVACENEKRELKMSNRISKITNWFLGLVIFGLVYFILKKK